MIIIYGILFTWCGENLGREAPLSLSYSAVLGSFPPENKHDTTVGAFDDIPHITRNLAVHLALKRAPAPTRVASLRHQTVMRCRTQVFEFATARKASCNDIFHQESSLAPVATPRKKAAGLGQRRPRIRSATPLY